MKKILLALLFFCSPASATTFCHVETGQCLDPQVNGTIGQYLARYAGSVTSGWNVVPVPDGTQHNAIATQNPDQSWSTVNPVATVPSPQPTEMGGKQFTNYCVGVLAAVDNLSASQALVRFGQIVAVMKSSTDPLTALAYVTFQAALGVGGKFTLADTTTLMQALAANGAQNTVTNAEATAIIANWPKG